MKARGDMLAVVFCSKQSASGEQVGNDLGSSLIVLEMLWLVGEVGLGRRLLWRGSKRFQLAAGSPVCACTQLIQVAEISRKFELQIRDSWHCQVGSLSGMSKCGSLEVPATLH